ncbi:hypothetical protein BLNAU_9113 [Blattamonas nauphoetae]|uniref:Uncharacterized protein n=1 Tax=Blattamonas nauphoetae TaxID=2049346 RepID=A0ABQ9XWU5_9EUKA|nr:hypothetical protein BLNAU_9113 [Blattamonas nauphoetae]
MIEEYSVSDWTQNRNEAIQPWAQSPEASFSEPQIPTQIVAPAITPEVAQQDKDELEEEAVSFFDCPPTPYFSNADIYRLSRPEEND